MIFTILLALSGLTLSAVAIYYSVIGLTAIFAAAFWPIVIMGTSLEVSKLVAASWLKANWERIPKLIKLYMTIAVTVLMLITSMGIFGFLSKAHSDQSLVSGDVTSKIAIYDEKIKTAKENIEANRKALKQMDEAVDQSMARSTDEKGADKAVAIRRGQQKERQRLLSEISAEQTLISKLNEEAAPIRAEVRKVEAEVGPIKYIAALVYGDNPDANVLERAVTWVIMVIIFVFDPMAVLLLLASQMTWLWYKQDQALPVEEKATVNEPVVEAANEDQMEEDVSEFFDKGKLIAKVLDYEEAERQAKEANEKLAEIEPEEPTPESVGVEPEYKIVEDADEEEEIVKEAGGIEAWNKLIEEAERAVEEEKSKFPEDPFKGQQVVIDNKGYIFNGANWIESPLSHSTDDIERPGDYLTPADEESKKKTTYIVKEENHQVRKEK